MVTVVASSIVAILRVPGVPPVFPLCDNSGTTNQNSLSTWENKTGVCNVKKSRKATYSKKQVHDLACKYLKTRLYLKNISI
jgi:hypothetical protein